MKKNLLTLAVAILGIGAGSVSAQDAVVVEECCETDAPAGGPMDRMRRPMTFNEFAMEGILLDINQQARVDSLNNAVKANARCGRGPADCSSSQCNTPACQGRSCAAPNCSQQDCPNQSCAQQNCPNAFESQLQDYTTMPQGNVAPKGKDGKLRKDGRNDNGGRRGAMTCPGPYRGGCPYGPAYVAKMKEILTPEQYVTFLENIVNMPSQMPGQCVTAPGMQNKACGQANFKRAKKQDKKAERKSE